MRQPNSSPILHSTTYYAAYQTSPSTWQHLACYGCCDLYRKPNRVVARGGSAAEAAAAAAASPLSHTHRVGPLRESLGSPAVTTSSRHALIASLKPCLFWVSEKRRLFGCSKMYIYFSYHLSLAESIVHVCVSVM